VDHDPISNKSKLHPDDRQRNFQVEWQTIVQWHRIPGIVSSQSSLSKYIKGPRIWRRVGQEWLTIRK
jgi:hypothetical protein